MNIAICYEGGLVAPEFGTAKQVKIYRLDEQQITGSELHQVADRAALLLLLQQQDAAAVFCGESDAESGMELMAAGIRLICGILGPVDMVAMSYASGLLDGLFPADAAQH